jgi:asparaginyl-tRNA synthetase
VTEAAAGDALGPVRVKDLGAHAGSEVTVRGWVTRVRDHAELGFLTVRDGTGAVQAVLRRQAVGDDVMQRLRQASLESAVAIRGRVRQEARAPGGFEVEAFDLEVIAPSVGYPITPKEHGIDFLLDHRHLWLRSSRQAAALRLRDAVQAGLERHLRRRGFVRVDSPILVATAPESTTDLFRTDCFGDPAFLSQSGQLYAEAACLSLERVYTFGPTFRAERSKTRRHLLEFWMLEPEMAHVDLEGSMALQEEMVASVVQDVADRMAADLRTLERDPERLRAVRPPFPRITYDEAVDLLNANGEPIARGDDFGAPHETRLGELFDRPVFVHRFPTSLKPFYMEPDPARPDRVLAADLIAPEGYGEIIGGSQRIADPDLLARRIAEAGLDAATYAWYMDLRRYGSVVHSGFGLGLERFVAWIAGLSHVREAIPFPRLYHRLTP